MFLFHSKFVYPVPSHLPLRGSIPAPRWLIGWLTQKDWASNKYKAPYFFPHPHLRSILLCLQQKCVFFHQEGNLYFFFYIFLGSPPKFLKRVFLSRKRRNKTIFEIILFSNSSMGRGSSGLFTFTEVLNRSVQRRNTNQYFLWYLASFMFLHLLYRLCSWEFFKRNDTGLFFSFYLLFLCYPAYLLHLIPLSLENVPQQFHNNLPQRSITVAMRSPDQGLATGHGALPWTPRLRGSQNFHQVQISPHSELLGTLGEASPQPEWFPRPLSLLPPTVHTTFRAQPTRPPRHDPVPSHTTLRDRSAAGRLQQSAALSAVDTAAICDPHWSLVGSGCRRSP